MKCNLPNRKSEALTPEEETIYRQQTANKMAKVMKVILRHLIPLLQDIPDYRDQRYIKYSKECLFLYGIMTSVMQTTSRRNANRVMTDPYTQENLKNLIPGLDSVPHADTLAKFLKRIDP